VNQRGELVGVVAADDALKVIAGDARDVVTTVRNEYQLEARKRP
jgi:hypothetical protein